jgi:hypothetical protein
MHKHLPIIFFLVGYTSLYASVLKFEKKIFPADYERFNKFVIYDDKIIVSTDSLIFIYDKEGKLLQRIGQKGQGPGEFRNIADFIVNNKEIVVADYHRKIAYFDRHGNLIKEIRTNHNIQSITIIHDQVLYLGINKKRNKEDIASSFSIFRLVDEKEVISFPDETITYAVHPSGKTPAFPWFPAPFPNRVVVLKTDMNGLYIFMTRCNSFFTYHNGGFIKVNISYEFKEEPIKNEDKKVFFKYIESVNQTKYPLRTKQSVEFPEKREKFLGTVSWGMDIALINLDHLIVISKQGEFVERIGFPKEIIRENSLEFYAPEARIQRNGDQLYYYDENEGCMKIFSIMK